MKEHYRTHGEAANAFRRKHPDVLGRGEFNRLNPTHFDFGASLRKPTGESSFSRLARQYKANASRRGLEFRLSEVELRTITGSCCAYCGVSPEQKMHSNNANGPYFYNGIDRVDSAKGYMIENCVPACKVCNRAKSNMPHQAWREWLTRITTHHALANVGFKKTLQDDKAKG